MIAVFRGSYKGRVLVLWVTKSIHRHIFIKMPDMDNWSDIRDQHVCV